jgi:hypothetical protein
MNALEFLAKSLAEGGFDGLAMTECSCSNDDLSLGGCLCTECSPAHKRPCDGSCEDPTTCSGHFVPADWETEPLTDKLPSHIPATDIPHVMAEGKWKSSTVDENSLGD